MSNPTERLSNLQPDGAGRTRAPAEGERAALRGYGWQYSHIARIVYPRGAVLLGIGGDIEVHALVAQGAEPIGQPWTVTDCDSNMLRTIGTRPAVDVLRETLDSLGEETRERAERNLLVGLAMDEYRHEYGRGDYLIRNIMGFDRQSGAIAINAHPRVGQTIQFQFRDAEAATCGITALLHDLKSLVGPAQALLDAIAPLPNRTSQRGVVTGKYWPWRVLLTTPAFPWAARASARARSRSAAV